uniref:Transmembrane protein n=1 Tax=Medicago truncatula TaxID=3880 RepID=I3SQ38_MEDTR|nr:unknown [Medicago truncatula]
MVDENENSPLLTSEIEEEVEEITTATANDGDTAKHVRTKVPEVEIHLFRQGKGPIVVFKSALGGWEQDQLEVGDILEKHGLKTVFAFNHQTRVRGVPVRFNPRNGRSILIYRDGAVVYLDGEPKDSLIKPITRILIGVAIITLMIVIVSRETPEWMNKFNFSPGNFSPWVLACVVIVFTRMRKRTKDFFTKRGW